MAIPIKRGMEKVPGGLMLVPLVVGAVINTAAPHTGTFFGSFTGALFTGLTALLAVFYVCLGATLDVRTAPYIARKGGVLLISKIAFAVVVGVIAGHVLGQGPVSGGVFGGLSALALVAAFSDTNGGLYMSLMGQFGRNRDVGAYSLMSLESGPFLTMVILGVAGLSAFPWQTLLGAILPLLLGMLLGNLDPEMRKFLAPLVPAMVPFLGLSLGFTLNLGDVWSAGLLGLALGVVVVLAGGAWMLFVDRVTKGNGVAGLAAASTAGNAAVVPAIVAEANDHYDSSAASATVLVAASVVVTAVLCPIVTALWFRYRVAGTALEDSAAREEPATVALGHESDAADPELPAEDYVSHPSGQSPGDAAPESRTSTLKTRRN